ncbi:Tyrosine--tRNA ligase [Candidatus Gugararchaeum adminiculabundum]|nr:Tyrosine--tRNA ligase [Candidatus Gugararchaeum adminiculabundum]
MDLEQKMELALRPPTIEVITRDELRQVFETYAHPRHYIGFEVSGKVHIGTGLMTALKVKDLMAAGCKPTILLADYHAWINGKFGGDLEKIQRIAKGYFKQAFVSLGLDEGKVNYVLASEMYEKMGKDYWKDVLEICNKTTIPRMMRCMTILGRTESEASQTAHLIYPAMQAADMFALDVQIAHAGLDQRKVHMLAREVAERMGKKKAVAIHGKLLMGLQGPQRMGNEEAMKEKTGPLEIEVTGTKKKTQVSETKAMVEDEIQIRFKMSKSKPETCIYVHDSEEEIKKKMGKAFCPERTIENNPIIDLAEQIMMRDGNVLRITRPAKFGGDIDFNNVAELKKGYADGKLHPVDLKAAVAFELARVLEPSRKYFEKHSELLNFGD